MNLREPIAAVDSSLFRRVMSRFATGVTVITAEAGGRVRGMTANAFMSGSLSPPLCLISIGRSARMHGHVSAAGHFGVNILAEGQEALGTHFAGRSVDQVNVEFERVGKVPLLKHASAQAAWALARALGGSRRTGVMAAFLVVFAGTFDGWRQLVAGTPLSGLDLWPSSRAITGAITEFPLFSFHLGDLHPHLLCVPFVLVAPTVIT